MSLILPRSTTRLINAVAVNHRHPGLQLDKFSVPGAQIAQKASLDKVCNIPGDPTVLAVLAMRRNGLLRALAGANSFACTTTGPLTLHLARASALENAGISLHPIYGFAYLPGGGLKGMARAYAEAVWLPAQTDRKQAWRRIEDVFGWAPNPDRRAQIEDIDHPAEARRQDDNDPKSPEIKSSAGSIVFHDAWPEAWPKLVVDIVNNHHPEYYEHDDNDHAPGDWENPRPVYFLAVKPGTTFAFALSKRRDNVLDGWLDSAREWLLGALCHLGAGAKTAAGYGAFRPVEDSPPALPRQSRIAFETTLDLVTPAFLAGANQQAEDCDLRPATLRGHLRWWWRTMHAGFLDVKTLRALEAAIWGDTRSGGAVRIVLEKITGAVPQPYDKSSKAGFLAAKESDLGIPGEAPRKTTQGLGYASYGMDDSGRRRYVLEPPVTWRLRLIARPTQFFADRKDVVDRRKSDRGKPITAEQALNQAQAVLRMLCHFGGVGSKAGKGFGALSIRDGNELALDAVKSVASDFRSALGLGNHFNDSQAGSAAFQQMQGPVEVPFDWPSVWSVMDQVGFACQTFAKEYKHQRDKMALGLPRRISPPARGTFKPRAPVTINGRHASPVRIHVEGGQGNWTVRVVAFPAARLPDLATSRTFLERFLADFAADLRRRAALPPPSGRPAGSAPASAPRPANGPAPVRVKFLGPHGGLKNAFWVQEEGKKRGLLKYGVPPSPLPVVDSEIEVYSTNQNPNTPEYRWDKPEPPRDPSRGRHPRRGGRS